MNENEIGTIIVDAAIEVHRQLGYLLNFGGELMRDGIVRAVNGLDQNPLRACAPPREFN